MHTGTRVEREIFDRTNLAAVYDPANVFAAFRDFA